MKPIVSWDFGGARCRKDLEKPMHPLYPLPSRKKEQLLSEEEKRREKTNNNNNKTPAKYLKEQKCNVEKEAFRQKRSRGGDSSVVRAPDS